jgi:hypothetical protein
MNQDIRESRWPKLPFSTHPTWKWLVKQWEKFRKWAKEEVISLKQSIEGKRLLIAEGVVILVCAKFGIKPRYTVSFFAWTDSLLGFAWLIKYPYRLRPKLVNPPPWLFLLFGAIVSVTLVSDWMLGVWMGWNMINWPEVWRRILNLYSRPEVQETIRNMKSLW